MKLVVSDSTGTFLVSKMTSPKNWGNEKCGRQIFVSETIEQFLFGFLVEMYI